MAEGSTEDDQSSQAAPASPPADLRIPSSHLSSPQYHQRCVQPPPLLYRQDSTMLTSAVPLRHSYGPLSHQLQIKTNMDASVDLPLNLKNEESEVSSGTNSPEPAPEVFPDNEILIPEIKNSRKRKRSRSSDGSNAKRPMDTPLNGIVEPMIKLQNLQNPQNLACFQTLPQGTSMAAGSQGMTAGSLSNQLTNAPLNLTVSASATSVSSPLSTTETPHLLSPSSTPVASIPQLLSVSQQPAIPQLILSSGQLIQGIQGAQLLIPTSQGIATQMILTIPVSHVTNNQIVNLALSNGQVISTTLANLQSIAQPQNLMNAPSSNVSGLGLSPSVLPHLLSNNSASQQLVNIMQPQQFLQVAQAAQALQVSQGSQRPLLATSTQHRQHGHRQNTHLNHYHLPDKHHKDRNEPSSPSNCSMTAAPSALNRLAATNGELTITTTLGSSSTRVKASPCSIHSLKDEEDDLLNDSPNQPTINEVTNNVVDGINLDEIKEFAKAFKLRRLSLGLTQTQVGQALSVTEGPAYSQSAICRFEKLDITPKSAQKIKPVLAQWMKEAEERYKSGANNLTDFIGVEPSKKRKRRTSFTPQALELLNAHFDKNTHPTGNEITTLAQQLGYEREVIRIWFCNKRQALKNTVRMMSKTIG